MSNKFTEDEARAFEWLMAGFSGLTAEERLEQMTRERDEARAQLAELATKKEKP